MADIMHYGVIRLRVVGSGNLKASFYGYDNILIEDLVDIVLADPNSQEQTRLGNFISQRAKLRVSVTEINEYFKFNSIAIFVKPLYTSYPDN